VGDDRVEVVADGGEVKAWLLDEKLQPMTASIEGRTITLAAADDTPHTVTLTFDATSGVYVGKWTLEEDPRRLTIVVKKGGVVHATLVGWKPGVVLVCGAKAPRIKVHVHVVAAGPKNDDDVDVKLKIKDKDKDKEKGSDKDKDKGEPSSASIKIDVKEKDEGKGKEKEKAKGKDK
jgi:hypothetical protein